MSEKEKENEKIAALEQRATKAEADLKKAQDDASANASRVNELSSELKAIKDEKHAGLVEQAYRARVESCTEVYKSGLHQFLIILQVYKRGIKYSIDY